VEGDQAITSLEMGWRIPEAKVSAIHQVVPLPLEHRGLARHVEELRATFRAAGFRSEVFVSGAGGGGPAGTLIDALPLRDLPGHVAGSVLVYHAVASQGAWEAVNVLFTRSEPLVTWYYGHGDAGRWVGFDGAQARALADMPEQLRLLALRSALGIGSTELAASSLVGYGFVKVASLPPIAVCDGAVSVTRAGQPVIIVSAGAIDPSVHHEDVVAAFALYLRVYDAKAKLLLAGESLHEGYYRWLQRGLTRLGIDGQVETVETAENAVGDASVVVCPPGTEPIGSVARAALNGGVPLVRLAGADFPGGEGQWGIALRRSGPALVAAALERAVRDTSLEGQLRELFEREGRFLRKDAVEASLRGSFECVTGAWGTPR